MLLKALLIHSVLIVCASIPSHADTLELRLRPFLKSLEQLSLSTKEECQVDAVIPKHENPALAVAGSIQHDLINPLIGIKPIGIRIEDFRGAKEKFARRIFLARLKVREQMQVLYVSGRLNEACARKVQRLERYYRGLEDYLGFVSEMASSNAKVEAPIAEEKPSKVEDYEKLFPMTDVQSNPVFAGLTNILAGDLLLSRGNAASSSAIARLSDEDSQFSHLAMVYVDLQGRRWVIQSEIELGTVIIPIEDWLKDHKKRTVVYRYSKNPLLAKTASIMLYTLMNEYALAHHGETIPYDFSLNVDNHEKLFCTEAISYAFEMASELLGEPIKVPLYRGHLTRKVEFLDQLGVTVTSSFLPADLEADPRFDLVLEWRNFAEIKESFDRDAISSVINDWMDQYGLSYHFGFLHRLEGKVASRLRAHGLLKDKLSLEATPKMISLMIELDHFYTKLQKRIEKREAEVIQKRGIPFSLFEVQSALRTIAHEKPRLITDVLYNSSDPDAFYDMLTQFK